MSPPVIGLALGSGSARGWAHIGVIRALQRRQIVPSIVCGTSIGSLVGAAYVAGHLSELETWVSKLKWQDVVSLLDVRLTGGLIGGQKLIDLLRQEFRDRRIEDCETAYAAVATNLETGNEVWLREGEILSAVRASIALPGLFTPVKRNARWLVDGGLVNPVPVSLCRAMGAEIVIAVDLNADLLNRHPLRRHNPGSGAKQRRPVEDAWSDKLSEMAGRVFNVGKGRTSGEDMPSILEVVARSHNIMSVRITRSRMAGDPPDVLLAPRLASIGLLEFHRADAAITEGMAEVEREAQQLEYLNL